MSLLQINHPKNSFEGMLENLQTKSRFLSQAHIEGYNDSVYNCIMNGEIQIPETSQQVKTQQPSGKNQQREQFEGILRKKYLQQIEKQKQQLQRKLEYVTNSITSMKNYDEMKSSRISSSPKMMRDSYTASNLSKVQDEQFKKRRKAMQDEILSKRQKQIDRKKKKEDLQEEEWKRIDRQRNEQKKKEMEEKLRAIQLRVKSREEQNRVSNEKYRKLRNQKSLYEKIIQNEQQKQSVALEQQKRKLLQIRNLRKPLDEKQLKDHETRFLNLKKQRKQARQYERKLSESKASYKPTFQGHFYKKIVQEQKNQEENPLAMKAEKVKKFSELVRENFIPDINQKKRKQITEKIEKQKRKQIQKNQKQKEWLEKSRHLGLDYLTNLRSLPKKKSSEKQFESPKTERIRYHNYLIHRPQNSQPSQNWKQILSSNEDKESKALKIHFSSQKKEIELKRKQKQVKLLKNQDQSRIDDEYYSMIMAKLQLLHE